MTDIKVVKLDRDEMRASRQAEIDKLGMTWQQVLDCVLECGCCLSLPVAFEHLSEEYVEAFWRRYEWMDLDSDD
jgi:hypothetical protein